MSDDESRQSDADRQHSLPSAASARAPGAQEGDAVVVESAGHSPAAPTGTSDLLDVIAKQLKQKTSTSSAQASTALALWRNHRSDIITRLGTGSVGRRLKAVGVLTTMVSSHFAIAGELMTELSQGGSRPDDNLFRDFGSSHGAPQRLSALALALFESGDHGAMLHMLEARHRRLASAPLRLLAEVGEPLQLRALSVFKRRIVLSSSIQLRAKLALCVSTLESVARLYSSEGNASDAAHEYLMLICTSLIPAAFAEVRGRRHLMPGQELDGQRREQPSAHLKAREGALSGVLDATLRTLISLQPTADGRQQQLVLSTLRCLPSIRPLYLAWRATLTSATASPTTRALLTQLTFAQGLARACLDAFGADTAITAPRGAAPTRSRAHLEVAPSVQTLSFQPSQRAATETGRQALTLAQSVCNSVLTGTSPQLAVSKAISHSSALVRFASFDILIHLQLCFIRLGTDCTTSIDGARTLSELVKQLPDMRGLLNRTSQAGEQGRSSYCLEARALEALRCFAQVRQAAGAPPSTLIAPNALASTDPHSGDRSPLAVYQVTRLESTLSFGNRGPMLSSGAVSSAHRHRTMDFAAHLQLMLTAQSKVVRSLVRQRLIGELRAQGLLHRAEGEAQAWLHAVVSDADVEALVALVRVCLKMRLHYIDLASQLTEQQSAVQSTHGTAPRLSPLCMCALTNCNALAGVKTSLGTKMMRYLSRALTVIAASSRRLSLLIRTGLSWNDATGTAPSGKRPRRDDRAVAERLASSKPYHASSPSVPGGARADLVRNWQRVVRASGSEEAKLTSKVLRSSPSTRNKCTAYLDTLAAAYANGKVKDQRAARCVLPILDALWLPSPASATGMVGKGRVEHPKPWLELLAKLCCNQAPIGAASARADIRVARRAQSLLHIILSQSPELDATSLLQVLLNRLATAMPTSTGAGACTATTLDETAAARMTLCVLERVPKMDNACTFFALSKSIALLVDPAKSNGSPRTSAVDVDFGRLPLVAAFQTMLRQPRVLVQLSEAPEYVMYRSIKLMQHASSPRTSALACNVLRTPMGSAMQALLPTLQAKIATENVMLDVIRNGPIRASRFVWNGARGAILLLAEIAAKSPAMLTTDAICRLLQVSSCSPDPLRRLVSVCIGAYMSKGGGGASLEGFRSSHALAFASHALGLRIDGGGRSTDAQSRPDAQSALAAPGAHAHSNSELTLQDALSLRWIEPAEAAAIALHFPVDLLQSHLPLEDSMACSVIAPPCDSLGILLTLQSLLRHSSTIDLALWFNHSVVGICVSAVSASAVAIRSIGFDCLAILLGALERSTPSTARQMRRILSALRDAITEPDQRLPRTTTQFVVRAMDILRSPAHSHFRLVNSYVNAHPHLALGEIPMAFHVLHSGRERSHDQSVWLLKLLEHAMHGGGDIDLLVRQNHVTEPIMALHGCSMTGAALRSACSALLRAVHEELAAPPRLIGWAVASLAAADDDCLIVGAQGKHRDADTHTSKPPLGATSSPAQMMHQLLRADVVPLE